MIAEYLEHALQFEQMASEATDPKLKDSFEKQSIAYRKWPRSASQAFDDAEVYPTHGNHWTPNGNALVANRLMKPLSENGLDVARAPR